MWIGNVIYVFENFAFKDAWSKFCLKICKTADDAELIYAACGISNKFTAAQRNVFQGNGQKAQQPVLNMLKRN